MRAARLAVAIIIILGGGVYLSNRRLVNLSRDSTRNSSKEASLTKSDFIPLATSVKEKEFDFLTFLENDFPECLPPNGLIQLSSMGFYRKIQNQSEPPRYDHVSCFVMKARYNCAYRPDYPLEKPHHYELALRFHDSNNSDGENLRDCSLRTVIDRALSSRILPTLKSANDQVLNPNHKWHIVLQGNSFVRQIWEALACTLPASRISDFIVQRGGPGIQLKDFTRRKGRLVGLDELGDALENRTWVQEKGCHGDKSSDLTPYFRRRAIKPPNMPDCNDNVAMIELDSMWRFYYIFKPTMYTNDSLVHLYDDRLRMPRKSTSLLETSTAVLVWNYVMKVPQNISPPIPVSRELQVESWSWKLRDLQLRDIGQFFGANNPWIKNPPDFHPCMPGIPDDEVNLLLFALWTGSNISAT